MVEQVDREAADEHVTIEDIWAAAPITRLFARHRTEATAALEERVKLLEAALQEIAHETRRQQLPITALVNDIATKALNDTR